MPKKFVGLFVAIALALTAQSFAVLPAVADTPQQVLPGQTPAEKAAAKAKAANAARAKALAKARAVAKAKAAATAAARARAAAAKARDNAVAASGPRLAAARRAAAQAKVTYAQKVHSASVWRLRASARTNAAKLWRARVARMPAKTKAQIAARKKAAGVAAAVARSAQVAVATYRRENAAVARARLDVRARAQQAEEAQIVYVALATPRADLAARQAAEGRKRAIVAARAMAANRTTLINTYKRAVGWRSVYRAKKAYANLAAARATKAAIKAAKLTRAQAKAVKAAAKAARATQKRAAEATRKVDRQWAVANTRYRNSIGVADRARALAQQLGVAAAQAKRAVAPNGSWNPTDSVLFNHPRGSRKSKYTLITQLNRAIDATPAGGDIRIAMYLFDIGSVADKLIAAHRRGVSVQILLDDNTTNKWIRKVKRALGTNRKARSFFGVCDHSCMSNGTSTIHAKFYLFSVAGKSKYVSLVSSGNPYSGNTVKSWNNTHTITKNQRIYDSLNRYFTDMLPDKNNSNYYRVTTSGKYTVYYYPQKIRRPDDLVWNYYLSRTSCRAPRGYGNAKGQTVIRIANWGWTNPRADVAKRVWALHNAGCDVQVMINSGRASRGILKILLRKSKKYGKMPVYNAWRDWRKKAVAGLYVHHKFVTISGPIAGRNQKLILTGSQNFTALGTTANNDLVLRVMDAKMLGQYMQNFAYIRGRYAKRMRSVPLITRVADREGGQ